MSLKSALDKIGIGGLLVTAVCCPRLDVVFSLLAAIGLGFLTRNTFLMPAMGTVQAVILAVLALDYGIHRRSLPLAIAVPSAAALYFFVFIHRVNLAVYLAVSGLILARILNLIFRQQVRRCMTASGEEHRSGIEPMGGQRCAGPKRQAGESCSPKGKQHDSQGGCVQPARLNVLQ